MRRAAERGLTTIALVDHDTLDGLAEAEAAGTEHGVRVVAGCEFSVAAPWGELHLLGYFLSRTSGAVSAFLDAQRTQRLARAERIIERLRRLGSRLALGHVLDEAAGGAVGRPHVARALVAHGEASDVDDAFRRLLGARRPAYVPKVLAPIAEVAELVRSIGGVSSAAHLRERATRRALRRLQRVGVDGVEVRHPGHDAEVERRIEALADELGLLKSGGSDWHGDEADGSPRASLGDVTVPAVWLEGIERRHRDRTAATQGES